jgi:quercetin dioxygenase-like cupin family protein
MKILDIKELEISKTAHKVAVKKMHETKDVTIVHIMLKPGESLLKHITPVDAHFYVLEGTGFVEIAEEKVEVKAGQLIFSPANIVHTLYNESDSDFKFLVVKTPTPTTQTKIL